jgi:hypothetical protein
VIGGVERGLDPCGDAVSQRRGLLEHVDAGVLGPAGEIRDAVGIGVQTV